MIPHLDESDFVGEELIPIVSDPVLQDKINKADRFFVIVYSDYLEYKQYKLFKKLKKNEIIFALDLKYLKYLKYASPGYFCYDKNNKTYTKINRKQLKNMLNKKKYKVKPLVFNPDGAMPLQSANSSIRFIDPRSPSPMATGSMATSPMAMGSMATSPMAMGSMATSPIPITSPTVSSFLFQEPHPLLNHGEKYYKILKQIGRGSYGGVYDCVETDELGNEITGEIYAIKKIMTRKGKNSKYETEILKILKVDGNCDDNILCYITDFNKKNGEEYLYIITKKVNGRPLDKLNLFVMKKCIETLQRIHNKGIIHRDIKQQNILIDDNDEITYIDFGLGCSLLEVPEINSCKEGDVGTLVYKDPFLFCEISEKSDIYSLGYTFFSILQKLAHEKQQIHPYILSPDFPAPKKIEEWENGYILMMTTVDKCLEKIDSKEEKEEIGIIIKAMCTPFPMNRPTTQDLLSVRFERDTVENIRHLCVYYKAKFYEYYGDKRQSKKILGSF